MVRDVPRQLNQCGHQSQPLHSPSVNCCGHHNLQLMLGISMERWLNEKDSTARYLSFELVLCQQDLYAMSLFSPFVPHSSILTNLLTSPSYLGFSPFFILCQTA